MILLISIQGEKKNKQVKIKKNKGLGCVCRSRIECHKEWKLDGIIELNEHIDENIKEPRKIKSWNIFFIEAGSYVATKGNLTRLLNLTNTKMKIENRSEPEK